MSKADPSKVSTALLIKALEAADGDRQKAFSQYIVLRFRTTGKLGPGCDAKDFYAAVDQYRASLADAGQVLEVKPAVKRSKQVKR